MTRKKISSIALVAVIGAVLFLIPSPAAAERLNDVEKYVFRLTNEERKNEGLSALMWEQTLSDIAAAHSRDMAEKNYFAHRSPEGLMVADRVARGHRKLVGTIGENVYLFVGKPPVETDMAEDMVENWMNSSGHRENILRDGYTHLGVGVYRKNNRVYATQVFAGVKAWLKKPLPRKIRKGARLNVSGRGPNGASGPDECRLYYAESDVQVSGPYEVNNVQLEIPPGDYRFKFYFLAHKGDQKVWHVFPGPEIRVY